MISKIILELIIFLCFVYFSIQLPAINNDDEFYTNLNKINYELIESQKNYSNFIDKSFLDMKKIFKMTRIEIFGSNMTKKFLLEEMENLKVPEVQLIRHKRQAVSSACSLANSKVAAIQSQLDCAYAHSNATYKKLTSAQKILNDLQTTKPQLKGIDPLFNFYLTIVWKLIVRLQTNCYLVAQKNAENLQKILNEQQTQVSAICPTTTVDTTASPASLQNCSYTWSSYPGDNKAPTDAFYVGKNQFGNDIYVGAATGNDDLAPGSLEPKNLNGVTMNTDYTVYNVTSDVQYLAIPTTCTCQWIKQNNPDTQPALVQLRDVYYVGRYTFNDGSFAIGKAFKGMSKMNYPDDQMEISTTVFDVLQCYVTPTTISSAISSTTVSLTTAKNTVTAAPPKCANCGLFSSCIIGSPINCICDSGKVQIPCLTIILGYCCL